MSVLTKKMASMSAFRARIPATQKQISIAEDELGLTFAKEYTEYLCQYGCASVFGHEFTGICSSKRLNVVNVTLEERKNLNLPNDWYVVEQANIDGIVICQSAEGNIYLTRPGANPGKIASSLFEYLDL